MARILVVGDVMLDHYIIGETTRISPEAPVPVVGVKREEFRPGGAANVAANIAAMGGDVTLLLLKGSDPTAQDLVDILRQYPLHIHEVDDAGARTTKKSRVVVSQQQIVRVDYDSKPTAEQQQKIFRVYSDVISDYDFIVFSDYAKGTLDRLPEFLALAKANHKFTLVDPKRRDPEFYRGASLLKPNRKEFSDLFGESTSVADISQQANKAISDFDIGAIVVTLGHQGMIVVEKDRPPMEMPTRAREVFDVSGAGDTVLAALVCDLAGGKNLKSAAETSNIAASIAVSHLGTYIVTAHDVAQEVFKDQLGSNKIITDSELPKLLSQLRLSKKKIVFTNGCFDILHPGHVRLFNEARSLGDVLIVGLNSDASVKALKGETRPINSFGSRAEVISGLGAVDYVIEFDAPTPIDLISKIVPDVLVKGGDYKIEEIVGHDVVQANGGEVRSLAFHNGYSTTRIVNDIAKSR
jgi:D-beta-D-heptose 7-phosphate kinase / D-beta-D-heptose 1-phosphate adenosyltransferase